MIKLFSVLALCLGFQAHANDSGIALVDVAGIAPANGVAKTELKLYGADTEKLAEVLPVTDVIGGRSVTLVSRAWVASISCDKEYVRPTTGLTRNDWMCSLSLVPRSESMVDSEEVDKWTAQPDSFSRFTGSSDNRVLGIVPSAQMGELFSVYGGQLGLLATKLPQAMAFSSPGYRVEFGCSRNYHRPTTGEYRNDYMCSLYIGSPAGVVAPEVVPN